VPLPKSITKTTKQNGKVAVEFIDNVEACNYTLAELTKAALRDIGKVLIPMIKQETPVLTGRLRSSWQKWVRKDKAGEQKLQIGVYSASQAKKKGKPYAFHAHLVLLGHATRNGGYVHGNNFFTRVVEQNVATIREIQGKYLSAIADANEAARIVEAEEGKAEDSD
jgi:hypothetical protein